ncbi:MAG: pantetheine-phosphate adenylyltransferase [Oscillospiraceae bacterium]|jgi:pantetheine-phosphate adenylyltransferase|nr:pantetheine-phosphate adenylyltransferase [Oscillospiraceae bacterium]
MITAIYPGTFDPVTLGHLDIIRRVSRIFDRLVVSVVMNIEKTPLFDVGERIDLIRKTVAELPNVEVTSSAGLLADLAEQYESPVVIKGLRNHIDYEYETTMAAFNKRLNPGLETFFIAAKLEYTYVSSRAVRQLAAYGADLSAYVPKAVADEIAKKILSGR